MAVRKRGRPGGAKWRRALQRKHEAGEHANRPRRRCPWCQQDAAVRANGTGPAGVPDEEINARSVLMAMLGGIDGAELPAANRRVLNATRRAVLVLVEQEEEERWASVP